MRACWLKWVGRDWSISADYIWLNYSDANTDPQLKLHLKLDEMKSLAMEATFCFKGKSGDAIAEFIEAYQSLLFSMYQYQILLIRCLRVQRNINGRLNRLMKIYMSPINGKISLKEKALLPRHTRLYAS